MKFALFDSIDDLLAEHQVSLIGLRYHDPLPSIQALAVADLEKALDFMIDYTDFHFSAEEELMAENNYPGLDAQKQAAAAELRAVEEKTQAEIAQNLRSRLLQLATRKRN